MTLTGEAMCCRICTAWPVGSPKRTKAVNKGAHGPYSGELGLLVADVKALIARPELA